MNIQISDSWLREYIDTKATPKQIGEYLSLCSQSVEKLIKEGKEIIYDIEITTNRPDCLSVYGIARELSAVLPRFGLEAKLKEIPVLDIPMITNGLPLQVKISKTDLCSRFTALVYDNVKIKPSPQFAQKRLNQAGIRALNNVIDISNYLMLELGQPMHTFDYDKILKHKMFLREAGDGEEIITLDGQKRTLKDGVIIIEDGEKRIIDLCGIMGAKNSETDENTKRVLLFVQTYNPMKIRRACQSLGFRTEASSRFEKGIDPEGVIPSMQRATLLFKEWCGGKVASQLFDIYPSPPKEKKISIDKSKIDLICGDNIKIQEAAKILDSLGFSSSVDLNNKLITSTVPHWRNNDIDIQEDLIEEIARLYGYHNLQNTLPPLNSVPVQDQTFKWEDKVKTALKYFGFTETVNYSLVARNLIINPDDHLQISNPLTEDLLYLRTSLIPSLLQVIGKNSTEEDIKIFEMANVYIPKGKDQLPDEIMTLTLSMTGKDKFFEMKGILEALLKELGIISFEIKSDKANNLEKYAKIFIKEINIGIIGEISQSQLAFHEIKDKVTVLNIELSRLLTLASTSKKYTPLPKYPPIIEDLSFIFSQRTLLGPVIEEIKNSSELIREVKLIDAYQDARTFRITYQSSEKNLSEKEARDIREKIIKKTAEKFCAFLKSTP